MPEKPFEPIEKQAPAEVAGIEELGLRQAIAGYLSNIPGTPIARLECGFLRDDLHPEWHGVQPLYTATKERNGAYAIRISEAENLKAAELSNMPFVLRYASVQAFVKNIFSSENSPSADEAGMAVVPILETDTGRTHISLDDRVEAAWIEVLMTIWDCQTEKAKQYHDYARMKLMSKFGVSTEQAGVIIEAVQRQLDDVAPGKELRQIAGEQMQNFDKMYIAWQEQVAQRVVEATIGDEAWKGVIERALLSR